MEIAENKSDILICIYSITFVVVNICFKQVWQNGDY